MPGAAARTNARSARSSTCRAASRGGARPDDIEKIIRTNLAQGLFRFFITDDNFARNKDWEIILDRLIHLREVEKLEFSFIIQVDTLCHKLPNFIDKCRRRGRQEGLYRAGEHQSGQSAGRQEEAEQDHRISQDAAGMAEGRHPGLCRLHHRLPARHGGVDPATTSTSSSGNCRSTCSRSTISRRCRDRRTIRSFSAPARGWIPISTNTISITSRTSHPRMSREEWAYAYRESWRRYYTLEHCERIMRRAAALRAFGNVLITLTWFKASHRARKCSSGRKRPPAPQVPPRPPADDADRAGLVILSQISRRVGAQDRGLGAALYAAAA